MLLGGIVEVVVPDAANKKWKGENVSRAADGRETMRDSVLEQVEGLVRLETLRQVLCALSTDAVVGETASKSQKYTSRAADGRETMRGGVLERGEGLVRLQAL